MMLSRRRFALLSALCVVWCWSVSGWQQSVYCPVTSPSGVSVYFTDQPTSVVSGGGRSQCAAQCAFLSAGQCRCFTYNSSSDDCYIYNYTPTSVANQSGLTTYQVPVEP